MSNFKNDQSSVTHEDLNRLHEDIASVKATISELSTKIQNLQMELIKVSSVLNSDHEKTVNHDKILVTGNGTPSLQELYRVLNASFMKFVETINDEREHIKEKEEEERKERRDERKRWKWALIGFGLTVIPPFLYQFIVFWSRIVPELEKISN